MQIKDFLKIETAWLSKDFFRNVLSLYGLQAINYVLPWVMLAYVVRVVGPEKYGALAFAQAIIQYFVLLTDYGFDYTATREIALQRGNTTVIESIVAAVFTIRFALLLISMAILTILVLLVPFMANDIPLYLCTFGLVLGNVLFPSFLFQGLERMDILSKLLIVSKIIQTGAVFLFVHQVEDYIRIPLVNSAAQITVGMFSLFIVAHKLNLRFRLPERIAVKRMLVDGWKVFFPTAAVSAYTTSNTVLLGFFAPQTVVGFYAGGEKIARAVQGFLSPISQTIFPHISQLAFSSPGDAMMLLKKSLQFIGAGTLLLSLCLYVFAKPVVQILLGVQFIESIHVLRILSFLPFVVGIAVVCANWYLLGFGYYARWARMILAASVFSILMTLVFVGLLRWEHIGMSISTLLTETLVMILSGFFFFRASRHASR